MNAEMTLAVHSLVYLWKKNTVVTSSELAESTCTNSARVRKIMSRLKHYNLVESREGKGSGYHTISDAGSIPLSRILFALDKDVISEGWKSTHIDKDCMISTGMGDVMSHLCEEMNQLCRDYLDHITIDMIANSILERSKVHE